MKKKIIAFGFLLININFYAQLIREASSSENNGGWFISSGYDGNNEIAYLGIGLDGNINLVSGFDSSHSPSDLKLITYNNFSLQSQIATFKSDKKFVFESLLPSKPVKLGVGITDPQEALHVNGAVRGNIANGALRVQSADGYLDLGAQNANWAHIYTDRAKVIFNKDVYTISNGFSSYNNDLILKTEGNERLRINDDTGNVGIGTTNPEEKLHIYGGTASIQGNIGAPTNHYWRTGSHTLELQNDDQGDVVLSFHRAGASNAAIIHPTSGGLKFSGRGVPTDNHMFMSSTGNLGIGTANPYEKLQISDSFLFHDGGHKVIAFGYSSSLDWQNRNNPNINGDLDASKYSGAIRFNPNEGFINLGVSKNLTELPERTLNIDKNGNVGLGTENIQAKLHIKNEDNTTSAILGENSLGDKFIVKSDKLEAGGGITKRFFMGIDDNGFKTQNGLSFENSSSGDYALYYEQEGSRILAIAPTTARFKASDSYGSTSFNFVVEGNVNSQTIKTSERIHIGSNATYNKSSAYSLSVEGKAIAEEIKVQKKENWSDFVFYDDYKLPTLKEVESHIAKKGHLKDIPSAKEVAKEGFFLGEMDAKLLQKIEELTLYTIAQEKKIEALEQENKTYKKVTQQLNDLLKRVKQLERN